MCCPCDRPWIMRQFSVFYIFDSFSKKKTFFLLQCMLHKMGFTGGLIQQKFSIFDKRIMMQQKYDFK